MKSWYFLPTLYWNQQSCFSVRNVPISNKRVWNAHIYNICSSTCCANWIALSIKGVHCMTGIYWKQLLDEVRVKIILISTSHWWRFVAATFAIIWPYSCVKKSWLVFALCNSIFLRNQSLSSVQWFYGKKCKIWNKNWYLTENLFSRKEIWLW